MTGEAHTDAQAVPRTEAGKRLLDEWAWMRAGHAPNTAKVRDLIVAAEAEAASLVTAPDLDVETLGRAWLNAMTEGEHDEECLRPTQAQDCPVGYEVREFVPKIAAEYARLRRE